MRSNTLLPTLGATFFGWLLLAAPLRAQCPIDDALEDNDDCVTAIPAPLGLTSGLVLLGAGNANGLDEDYFWIDLPVGFRLDVTIYFLDLNGDTDLYLYDQAGGACHSEAGYLDRGFTTSDNEDVTYENTSGALMTIEIVVDAWGTTYDCNDYDLEVTLTQVAGSVGSPFCLGDGSFGGCPCGNGSVVGAAEGCVNGTGVGAFMSSVGNASVAADSLVLSVEQAPPNVTAIFVSNLTALAPGTPFYDGLLCMPIDDHTVRHHAPPGILPVAVGANGIGAAPQTMSASDWLGDAQAGVTVYYQCWLPDASGVCGSGATFSSGLSVIWGP